MIASLLGKVKTKFPSHHSAGFEVKFRERENMTISPYSEVGPEGDNPAIGGETGIAKKALLLLLCNAR